jgi:hypothetical protein
MKNDKILKYPIPDFDKFSTHDARKVCPYLIEIDKLELEKKKLFRNVNNIF